MTIRSIRIAAWLPAALLVLLARPALATTPSLSGIRILYRKQDVVVSVTTHISRLECAAHSAKPMTTAALDRLVRQRLRLRLGGRAFHPARVNVIADKANELFTWQAIVPGRAGDCNVLARIYPEDPATTTVVMIMRDCSQQQAGLGPIRGQVVIEYDSNPVNAWKKFLTEISRQRGTPDLAPDVQREAPMKGAPNGFTGRLVSGTMTVNGEPFAFMDA